LAYFFFFGSLLSLFVSVVDVCNEFAVIIGWNVGVGSVIS
jgi:hypothetical protein